MMAQERHVVIGIITVPAEYAQNVADLMVAWGIKAIWNFTPVAHQGAVAYRGAEYDDLYEPGDTL